MDLRIGERLKNLSGDTVWVQQKLALPGPAPVYNLEVQDEHVYYVGAHGVLAHNVGKKPTCDTDGSNTPNVNTTVGYGVNDPPVRIEANWSDNDLKQSLLGHPPRGLGSLDLHHAGQMPGAGIHEIIPSQHRTNSISHPSKFNQGVTNEMRRMDRQLHWWYRAREQGADQRLPGWIYDED